MHGIEWLLPSHAPTNYLTPKWISDSPRRATQRVTTGIVRIDHVPHGIFISRCSPMLPCTSIILDLFWFRDPHRRRYFAGVALKTCYPKAPPFSSSWPSKFIFWCLGASSLASFDIEAPLLVFSFTVFTAWWADLSIVPKRVFPCKLPLSVYSIFCLPEALGFHHWLFWGVCVSFMWRGLSWNHHVTMDLMPCTKVFMVLDTSEWAVLIYLIGSHHIKWFSTNEAHVLCDRSTISFLDQALNMLRVVWFSFHYSPYCMQTACCHAGHHDIKHNFHVHDVMISSMCSRQKDQLSRGSSPLPIS